MHMFALKQKSFALILGSCMLLASYTSASTNVVLKKNIDGSVIYPRTNTHYSLYLLNKQNISEFNHGRAPTPNEIKAWNKDVMPDGEGLPQGQGSVEQGDELYSAQCLSCHGDFGAGGNGYPTLTGGQGTLKNQLLEAGDQPPMRTIGSYWPYASTLFWYIQSSMPFNNPKSLSNDETYALVAYLLSVNEIEIDGIELEDEYVLTKEKFLKIKMPNVDGFYPVSPERSDLKEQRPPLAQGTRCMKNCKSSNVVFIKNEIKGFDTKISTIKDLVKTKNQSKNAAEKEIYSQSCAACHSNDSLGAPVLGDKVAWSEVLKKGVKQVYTNAIDGINAMPPRGGNMELSDKELENLIDYMINVSK